MKDDATPEPVIFKEHETVQDAIENIDPNETTFINIETYLGLDKEHELLKTDFDAVDAQCEKLKSKTKSYMKSLLALMLS
jgi:hypothetical protein